METENFKVGDMIEMLEGAPYTVTFAGTKWKILKVFDRSIEIGAAKYNVDKEYCKLINMNVEMFPIY